MSNGVYMDSPKLIEHGVYMYLQNTLYNCKERRSQLFYFGLNITVFLLFAAFISIILYFCYSQKKSPYEEYQKQLKDQEYILSKIRFYQGHMHNLNIRDKSNITGLPSMS